MYPTVFLVASMSARLRSLILYVRFQKEQVHRLLIKKY